MLDVQLATDTFSQQAPTVQCLHGTSSFSQPVPSPLPCRLPRCPRQSVSFVNLAFFLCLAFLRRAISFALDTVTAAVDCFCHCRPRSPCRTRTCDSTDRQSCPASRLRSCRISLAMIRSCRLRRHTFLTSLSTTDLPFRDAQATGSAPCSRT